MPNPALVPAIVTSVASLAGQSMSNSANQANNKQAWAQQLKLYKMQREDNERMWHMTNEYNSPVQQMARLRQGGLNPHLVYGNGAGGMTASTLSAGGAPSVSRAATEWDLGKVVGGGISAYYDVLTKEAQLNNLEKQNQILNEEAKLKGMDVEQKGIDLELNKVYSGEERQIRLNNYKAQFQYTLDENERRTLINSSNLKEAAERIMNYRLGRNLTTEEIRRIRNSNELQELDLMMRKDGLNPNGPIWERIIGRALNMLFEGSVMEKILK